jgi:hypothetical protein
VSRPIDDDDHEGALEVLSREVLSLREQHAVYVEFFTADTPRVALMLETAPYTFRMIQYALQDQILLTIYRLTEPETSGRGVVKRHLCLASLPAMLVRAESGFRRNIKNRVRAIQRAAADVDEIRHRVLAHFDRSAVTDPTAPVPQVTMQRIGRLIESIRKVMELVERELLDTRHTTNRRGILVDVDLLFDRLASGARPAVPMPWWFGKPRPPRP